MIRPRFASTQSVTNPVEVENYLATNTNLSPKRKYCSQIVGNVPALGCGDDLLKLFANYGDVEECKPMDAEESQRSKGHPVHHMLSSKEAAQLLSASFQHIPDQKNYHQRDAGDSEFKSHSNNAQITRVSSDKDCFPSQPMNQTIKTVRDKLNL